MPLYLNIEMAAAVVSAFLCQTVSGLFGPTALTDIVGSGILKVPRIVDPTVSRDAVRGHNTPDDIAM